MPRPLSSSVPSESTIEQIANHQIINIIGPYDGWFFVPTRNEEKRLGYDASLQNYKVLIIQYKRFIPNKHLGGRISISPVQHHQLISNFKKMTTPYVFYGFSTHPTYSSISNQFIHGLGRDFGNSMIFIDAHSIPSARKSISTIYINRHKIPTWKISDLASNFVNCRIGLKSEDIQQSQFERTIQEPISDRINILWAKIPKQLIRENL